MKHALFFTLFFAMGCSPAIPQPNAKKDCTPRDCMTSAPTPGCVEYCAKPPVEDDAGGFCSIKEETPCVDASTPSTTTVDASKPPISEAPLPPPRPTTIALSRTSEEKELAAGDESFEKNDLDGAQKHYQAAAKGPGAIVGLARVRIAKTGLALDYGAAKGNKEVEAAVKDLKRAAALDDTYGPAHVELGRGLLMLGDADAALASLTKGVALLPKEPEAHSALGVAKLALGKTDDALAALGKAAELDPGSAARHGNYGTVLLLRGRVADSVKEYRTAARIAPNDARAHSDLGTALLANNDVLGAIAELERAIALDPNRATYHSNYGYALQIKGDVQKAIAEYRAAIRLDEKLASAWINLATALARDPATRKEARAALEKARAIDATDPRVKANFEELDQLEKGH